MNEKIEVTKEQLQERRWEIYDKLKEEKKEMASAIVNKKPSIAALLRARIRRMEQEIKETFELEEEL